MGLEVAVGLISLGAAAVGYSQQRKAQKDQQEEQRKQNLIGQANAANENRRRMRKKITQLRIAQAQTESSSVQQGVQGSSGAQGAQSSAVSQFSTDVQGFSTDMLLGQMFNESQNRMGAAQSRAATGQAIQGVGMSVFNATGGFNTQYKAFKGAFG